MDPFYDKGRYAHYKLEETECYQNQKYIIWKKKLERKAREFLVLVVYMRKQGRVEIYLIPCHLFMFYI